MISQCVVIMAIILIISIGFYATRKRKWTFATLPLGILPFANTIIALMYRYVFKTDYNDMAIIIVLISGTVVSCTVLGMLTMHFMKSKEIRTMYISVGTVYNVMLAVILFRYYFL